MEVQLGHQADAAQPTRQMSCRPPGHSPAGAAHLRRPEPLPQVELGGDLTSLG